MKDKKLQRLVLIALFAAMTTVATMVLPFSVGVGYVHPGDCIILLCAWLLGPVPGAVAGALGAGLADILLSYAAYVPATLVIKALMGLCSGALFICMKKQVLGRILGGVVSGIVMVLGYFLYELLLWDLAAAIPGISGNLFQVLFNLAAALAIYPLLHRLTRTI